MPGMHMLLDMTEEEENRAIRAQYREPIAQVGEDWFIKPIPGGMTSGRGALHVWIPGRHRRREVLMYAETSVESWMQATAVIRARFNDQIEDPGWAVVPEAVKQMLIPRYVEALRRVIGINITDSEAKEIAEMFLDALVAGSPEDLHGG